MLQAAQEAQVEDLELVVQLHADDAVVSVDAQQDPGGLAVFAQNHLHLREQHHTQSTGGSMEQQAGGWSSVSVFIFVGGRENEDFVVCTLCVYCVYIVLCTVHNLVVLGGRDGLQVIAADADHLLRLLHEH